MRFILNILFFTQALFKGNPIFSEAAPVKTNIFQQDDSILNPLVSAALNPKVNESADTINEIMHFHNNIPLLAAKFFTIREYNSTLLHHALSNYRLRLSLELIHSLPDNLKDGTFDTIAAPSSASSHPLEFLLNPSIPEDLRLSVTKALLARGSSIYLRQRSQLFYKTILQAAIIKNLDPQFCELLVVQGGAHPGYHPDYVTNLEDLLSSPIGLAAVKTKKPLFEQLLDIFLKHGANINELIPYNSTWNATILGILLGLPTENLKEAQDDRIYKVHQLIFYGSKFLIEDNFGRDGIKLQVLSNKDLFSFHYYRFFILDYLSAIFPFGSPFIRFLRYIILDGFSFIALLMAPLVGISVLAEFLSYQLQKFKSAKKPLKKTPQEKKDTNNNHQDNKPSAGVKSKDTTVSDIDTKKQNSENKDEDKKSEKDLDFTPEALLKSKHNDSEIKRLLSKYFEQESDLNSFWGEQGDTLLMHLISNKHIGSAKFVIDKIKEKQSYLINEVNNHGQTALMIASKTNSVIMINYLLDEKRIPNLHTNLRDKRGDNALSMWLQHSSPSTKQTFSYAKKLIQRGCQLTTAARSTFTFKQFDEEQRKELECLTDFTPEVDLEKKKIVKNSKNQRRSSENSATRSTTKNKITSLKKMRKTSLPIEFEELKTHEVLQYRENPSLFRFFHRSLQYLIRAFNRKHTTPIEHFCRHAELLMLILDLSKTIDEYNKSNKLYNEKSPVEELLYYIRHCVIPLLLNASLLSCALSAIEEIAHQFIQWIPKELRIKILTMPSFLEHEMQELSAPLQNIIIFFQGKNLAGLHLSESKLFTEITRFHAQVISTEFVPAKHEAYVFFALPIIYEIYTKTSTNLEDKRQAGRRHVLTILLCSCGDAYTKYNNANQSKAFGDFVDASRITFRNRLLHDPKTRFLDVEPQQIHELCSLAQYALSSQGLNPKPELDNTTYGRESANQSVAVILSSCGLFGGNAKIILEYLGSPIKRKKKYDVFIPSTPHITCLR